jgi:hypothetical protein
MVALVDMVYVFLCNYVPKFLNIPLRAAWKVIGAIVVPLGSFLGDKPNGYIMASTTYVLAEKSNRS